MGKIFKFFLIIFDIIYQTKGDKIVSIPEKDFPSEIHRGQPKSSEKVKNLFLYNKSLDALLYAYFQEKSVPVEIGVDQNGKKINQTRVWKSQLPTQNDICKIVRLGTDRTYRNKLAKLKQFGYIEDKGQYFVLNNPQTAYLPLPLDTVKFLVDTYNSQTIKVYIYLGQGDNLAKKEYRKYIFTKKELINSISIKDQSKKDNGMSQYQKIDNILDSLTNNELIKIEVVASGKVKRLRLVEFNTTFKKNEEIRE